ncbi:MAG: DUF3833 family protein, partial [Gemmatimonadales bacterium]
PEPSCFSETPAGCGHHYSLRRARAPETILATRPRWPEVSFRIAYRVLAGVAMAGIAGCLGLPPFSSHPVTAESPTLEFEVFFAGRTQGKGTLELVTGRRQLLHVEGHGYTEVDGSFRLDQVVTFEDGAVEKRTWRLAKRDRGTYTGTLTDADGPVSAEVTGNRFHLRYLLRKPAVYMEQYLYVQPDGRTVLNLATITVLGIPVARLTEEITRVDDREQEMMAPRGDVTGR